MGDAAASASVRGSAWKWLVCGLLLLATVLNYMDRYAFNSMSPRITEDMHLSNENYGDLELYFGITFALGALLAGWGVDRWNVQWFYPVAVLAWSAAGFATGFVQSLAGLLCCRIFLGLFESVNWPCAIRTTQRILPPQERTLGNGLLQSGTALGAILTPLVVLALVSGPGTWRDPFKVIGVLGVGWAVLWLATVKGRDLVPRTVPQARAGQPDAPPEESLWEVFFQRRFLVLVILAVTVNITWHFYRVWLPKYLENNRGYSFNETQWILSCYYIAADAGSLVAGFAALTLARRGLPVHRCRVLVFLAAALMTALSVVVARLPVGWLLLGMLFVLGFGSLALFAPYFSFTQELTTRHQGKVTGTLGMCAWVFTSPMHKFVGWWRDQAYDFQMVVALAGLFPLIGFVALICLWGKSAKPAQ